MRSIRDKAANPSTGAGLRRVLGLGATREDAHAAPGQNPLEEIDDLDLREIGRMLWRRRAWIVLPTIAAAILSFVAVNMVTPRYTSEARILIEGRENIFLRPNAERVEDRVQLDQEAVTSQVQLILSRDLARRVIAKENLMQVPEFDPVLRGVSPLKAVLALFGIGRDPLKMTPEERVLEAYYERLTAFAVDKSRVIAVEFSSRDPELAARVTNAIADGYLTLQQSAKRQQARDAVAWLSGEIESLRKTVAEAEQRVEDFRGKSNLFIGTNNTTLSGQQLGEINSQLANARAQKSDAEARARFIRDLLRTGQTIEASDVLNSELIRRLAEQRVTLRAQLAEQSSTLLGNHPRIKELRAQIFDLDRQIREEAAKLARSLETESRIAGARVDSLSASLEQLKRQAVASGDDDVKLRALEREARSQRDLLESYLAKFREASTRETIDAAPADARIISRAFVSNTPSYPKKLPIVLIATLATLMLTSGIVAAGELLRQTSGSQRPASRLAGGVRLLDDAIAPVGRTMPISVEAIGALAESVATHDPAPSRILISGAGGAQAGLVALTFARALARRANVVLVDLMAGGDEIAAISSETDAPGLYNLIAGDSPFSRLVTRDRLSPLHLVSSGRGAIAEDVMNSPRTAMAIEALGRVYDYVVIGTANLDELPAGIAARCRRAVLVLAADVDDGALLRAQSTLAGAGIVQVDFLAAEAAGQSSRGRFAATVAA